jgi:peptidoglycan hydrolase-like protein with peptidoglycan-binding domain
LDPALQELLAEGLPDDEVGVVLRLVDPSQIPDRVRIVTQFGHIATCRLRRADIPRVRTQPQVASMKRARSYTRPWPEDDSDIVDTAEAEVFVVETDQRRPDGDLPTGEGVAVAHIDWGVDFAHPDFRTADGRSRLLALWDQSCLYDPAHPNPYGYGRIYDHEQISHALRTADPYATLGYHPAASDGGHGSHGTHTLGISAGSGLGGGPSGVAPGAALIFVHLSTGATEDPALLSREAELVGDLGDSVGFLEGLDFIQRRVGDRPVVINASVGRIAGEHDGFALTEQGMDAFLNAGPGRAIVNSAGNYFDRAAHACGVVRPGQEREVRFTVPAGASLLTEIDLWYPGSDRLRLSVRAPGTEVEIKAVQGERIRVVLDGREVGRLYHRIGDPNNGDNEITLFLDPAAPAGEWELRISGEVVVDGRFHAWIERTAAKAGQRSRFHEDDSDPTTTLGTICNGFRTIAVGAYNGHEPGRPLAPFSSCGPDRYGRPKPDLAAPGVRVLSARSHPREPDPQAPLQVRMSGTSMAAPCVAGAIALIFAAARRPLTIDETRRILLGTTDPIPPEADYIARMRLGSGYLNTAAAVAAAQDIRHSPPQAATRETEAAAAGVTEEQPAIAEPSTEQAMKTTSQLDEVRETGAEHCAVCGRASTGSAPADLTEAATQPEVEAEALSRRDTFGRPSGGGGGLPFQFQIPITGGAPALALPFGGSASPFAFTVPLGGSPAPQPPSAQPAAQPTPTPPSTPSEPPTVTVASADTPLMVPGTEGALTDSEFWQTDALGAEAVELLNIETAQGEASEAVAVPLETSIAQRPFGELVLEAAEGLDPSATDEPGSASVLEALARTAVASLLGSSTAEEDPHKLLFNGLPTPTASTLFNGLAGAQLGARAPSRLVALARPNEIVREAELRPGDLFIRVARGEGWGRVAIVASPRLYERNDLAAYGLRGEGYPLLLPGQYVHVVEPCTARRLSTTRFARRLTDDKSRALPGTLILRIIAPAEESDVPETQPGSKARSNGARAEGDRLPVLRKGDSGDAVRRLQQAINRVHAEMVALGLPGLPGCPLPEDGRFDEAAERAVVALQQTLFNDPAKWDGVVGKETWRQLEVLTGSPSQPAELPAGAARRARADGPTNGRSGTQRSADRSAFSGARRAASGPAQLESYGEASPCDQAIDPSQLSWPGASSDQMDLMRRVYLRQAAAACRVRTFVGDVPDQELGTIEQQIKARQSAADSCRQLLAAARAALSADPSATTVGSIGVVSGYRSASHQFANWNRAFPQYYAETLAQRRALEGGEFGERAAALLANYIAHRLAAPGFSLHNDGLAIDFMTVQGAATMGANISAPNRDRWRRSWFFAWLGANAPSYGFFQNTSIDEPWHWEFRPTSERARSVPAPDTAEVEYVDQDTFTESTIITGRLELSNTPLLVSHRGTQPDLILRWNTFNDPAVIDTVVHLHGYSSDRERMKLTNKEAYSGLDFVNPVDASDARPGRIRPTLGILPRGSYEGDRPKVNPERYTFLALTSGTGLSDLISYSFGAFATAASLNASLPTGRLILTAHSGGGAALMQLLAQSNPDEVYCFDALYTDASPLIAWLNARIAAEIQAWTPNKLRADGGLCVIYRPGGTKAQSLRVDRSIRAAIATAPASAQGPLQNAYRVLRTSVAHGEIPRRFGWLLLSDVAQSLAGTLAAETEAWNEGVEAAEAVDRSSQDYIRWIQTSLNSVDSAGLKVDGINGPKTHAAIREFQNRHALVIDGVVGPQTEAEMIGEGAPRPPGYSLCAVAGLGIVDPTNLNISPVGENDYAAGTFTSAGGRVLHVRGNVVYPATANGSGTPFNPNLGGPAPIIFMAHGNHFITFDPADRKIESCGTPGHLPIANHKGYFYLQELLAGMGIICVSVDCNETNCSVGLSARNIHERADLIVASIRHFQSLNSGRDPIFGGHIDFSRVGLFGHSRGGEAVVVVPELTGPRAPAGATIVGVLSLAPTDAGASSGAPRDYTFMTILPAADGDVRENDGAKYYDQAKPHPFKTQLYVHDANHNFFNSEWVTPDSHSGAGPLTRPEHERILSVYGSAFFREVFFAHGFQSVLLGKEIPPAARTGKVHVSAEVENPKATVDDHENNNVTLNTLGQTVTLVGFSTADEFPFRRTVTAFNSSFFGNTNGLVVRRSSATNRLRSPLGVPMDLTGKEISFRVAEVYAGSIPRGRTGFRIGLEDAGGRIAFADSNAAGTLSRPFDRKTDDLANVGTDLSKTMLETMRFPVGCFGGVSGFNVKNIQAIHLQLNRSDGRALAFDQLQIV